MDFNEFVSSHQTGLEAVGLPKALWENLYRKLYPKETFDGGNYFILVPTEDHVKVNGNNGPYLLCATKDLKKEQDVFLIDQFWTSDGGYFARKQVNDSLLLQERLCNIFGLDDLIDDDHDNVFEEFSQSTIIQQMYSVTEDKAELLLSQYKGCLLDCLLAVGNPELFNEQEKGTNGGNSIHESCSLEEFKAALGSNIGYDTVDTYSDSYLKKLYKSFIEDKSNSGEEQGKGTTLKYSWIDDKADGFLYIYVPIPPGTKKSDVKSCLTPSSWQLIVAGREIFSGAFSSKVVCDESYWSFESPGLLCMALQKSDQDKDCKTLFEGERLLSLQEIMEKDWRDKHLRIAKVKRILDRMWSFIITRPSYVTARQLIVPFWYLRDELGSAITHDSVPNINQASFFDSNHKVMYDIIWPLKDVPEGESLKGCLLTPLFENELKRSKQLREQIFISGTVSDIASKGSDQDEPNISLSSSNERKEPVVQFGSVSVLKNPPILCVYSNIAKPSFVDLLSGVKSLKIAQDTKDVDVFLFSPETRAANLKASHMVNSLSSGHLGNLHFVFDKAKRKFGDAPWLPEFYELQSEFPQFISAYQKAGYGCLWFLKSAVSHLMHFDPVITSHLQRISRIAETGKTLATKYIANTLLYGGRKCSLSYTVVVLGTEPLRILIHNRPFIRCSREKFDPLKLFDEYDSLCMKSERADTTPAYQDLSVFEDFITSFNSFYSKLPGAKAWDECERDILSVVAKLSEVALSDLQVCSPAKSFGLFSVDVILSSTQQPIVVDFDLLPTFVDQQALCDSFRLLLWDEAGEAAPCNSFLEAKFLEE